MRILVAAVVAVSIPAAADPAPESIALAAADPAFGAALDDALAPAGMAVIPAGEIPAPSIASLSTASRELADRLHSTATVWLIAAPTGATLVTYDRERDRLLVRELPYTLPLSAPQAAEAARTARTMLRALRVTPDIDQPPPLAIDAPAIREIVAVRESTRLSEGAVLGMRIGAPATDVGGALQLVWRPDRLGLAISGELGPTDDIMLPTFTGDAVDGAVAVMARMPFQITPKVRIAPMLGVAVHVIRLHGALDVGTPVRITRFDPAARAGLAATYELGPNLDAGVAISLDCLLDRQKYETGSEAVLDVPRVQGMIGAIVTLRVL